MAEDDTERTRDVDQDQDQDQERRQDQREEDEDASDLPNREAMSLLVDPTSLLGSGLVPNSPTSPPSPTSPAPGAPTAGTPPTDVPTPGGTVNVPHIPVPEANPGGTYNPDTSSTAKG